MKLTFTKSTFLISTIVVAFSCSTNEPSKTSIAEIDQKIETLYRADSLSLKDAILGIAEIDASGEEKRYLSQQCYEYVNVVPIQFYGSFKSENKGTEDEIIFDSWSDFVATNLQSESKSIQLDKLNELESGLSYFKKDELTINHRNFVDEVSKKISKKQRVVQMILIGISALLAFFFALKKHKKFHALLSLAILVTFFMWKINEPYISLSGFLLFITSSLTAFVIVIKSKDVTKNIRIVNILLFSLALLIITFRTMHWPGTGLFMIFSCPVSIIWLGLVIWNFRIFATQFSFGLIYFTFNLMYFFMITQYWFS